MDTLELRLAPAREHAWQPHSPDLVILVNARELVDLVREVELPSARAEGSPGMAGGYAWLPARLVLPPASPLLRQAGAALRGLHEGLAAGARVRRPRLLAAPGEDRGRRGPDAGRD